MLSNSESVSSMTSSENGDDGPQSMENSDMGDFTLAFLSRAYANQLRGNWGITKMEAL